MGNLMQVRFSMASGDPLLPPGYVRKSWIGSVSNSYIITDYVPKMGDEISLHFLLTELKNYHTLFSAGVDTQQLVALLGNSSASDRWCRYFSSGSSSFSATITSSTWYAFTVTSNGTFGCAGGSVTVSPDGELGDTDYLYLFRRANNTHNLVGQMSDFKVTNNGQIKLNLLPCQRVSDGVAGMYDTCAGKFYGAQNPSYPFNCG